MSERPRPAEASQPTTLVNGISCAAAYQCQRAPANAAGDPDSRPIPRWLLQAFQTSTAGQAMSSATAGHGLRAGSG